MANEWNTSYPVDHTKIGDVPGAIRTLKTSAKAQIGHEHEDPVDGDATGSEHKNGSAVAYVGTTDPTVRPDGATDLADNDIDNGRLWIDTNYDPPILKRWNVDAWEEINRSSYNISGATVFNTTLTASNTFQDLDLSAIVGAKVVKCDFEVKCGSGTIIFCMKTKGMGSSTVSDHYMTGDGMGNGTVQFTTGKYAYMSMVTDSSGIIQIAATSNAVAVTIKLIGYTL